MCSLLNSSRPPVFCPGCSHERITRALDKAFQNMNLDGSQIAIVTDIGCSGLFDTFFNTHAFHGLHGRALTYAAGIKMAQPKLNVIVTMGDGGLGIGGAHILSACRRNLDMTLLILNNFNFGMTGGQFSATTPMAASLGSGFLNRLEKPMDVCHLAISAGATYVTRCSSYAKNLSEEIEDAIRFKGFSLMDVWGICPGRYTRQNQLTPKMITDALSRLPSVSPNKIETQFKPPEPGRQEVVILGSAGQRVITAGEILCLAGLSAGLKTTQKNEYDITVLRGPSISELILSPDDIGFTGIENPSAIIAISQEGADRRKGIFESLDANALVIKPPQVDLPASRAKTLQVDFKSQQIKPNDWALAALSVMAKMNKAIQNDMLRAALAFKFKNNILASALDLAERVKIS